MVLIAYLENMTRDRTFLVGRDFNFGVISSYQNILLTIIDKSGEEVGCPLMSATSTWEMSKLTAEEVRRSYLRLGPGQVFGLKTDLGCKLKPGRYHVSAKYRDDFSQVWMQNKNIDLEASVWTQTLTSNVVAVEILP